MWQWMLRFEVGVYWVLGGRTLLSSRSSSSSSYSPVVQLVWLSLLSVSHVFVGRLKKCSTLTFFFLCVCVRNCISFLRGHSGIFFEYQHKQLIGLQSVSSFIPRFSFFATHDVKLEQVHWERKKKQRRRPQPQQRIRQWMFRRQQQ